jgi:hypothetical protein
LAKRKKVFTFAPRWESSTALKKQDDGIEAGSRVQVPGISIKTDKSVLV